MEKSSIVGHDYIVLAICTTIGFISFVKNLYKFAKWVWSNFFRPPKQLTIYGSWALVTGCTDGIGKALTFELASKDLNLILVSRNPKKLQATSNEIAQKFGSRTKLKTIAIDFAETTIGEEIEERVRKEIEGLDVGVLVNNAGSAGSGPSFFHEFDLEDENSTMSLVNVNIASMTWVTRAVLPGMLKRKRGAIVNIGSGSSVIVPSFPLCSVYAATKAYVAKFSRSLSAEYKQYGIDIQCQVPLFVATNMVSVAMNKSSFFVPSANQFSKASARWIGYDFLCVPYWTHAMESCLVKLVPDALVNLVMFLYALSVRKKIRREKATKNLLFKHKN